MTNQTEREIVTLNPSDSQTDEIQLAEVRREVYRFLSLAFSQPTRALAEMLVQGSLVPLLAALHEDLGLKEPEAVSFLSGQADELRQQQTADQLLSALKQEYARLFITGPRVPAPPYESVYRLDVKGGERGLLMGPAAVDVLGEFQEAGLEITPGSGDLPDHIAVELEFMYYLSSREVEAWQAQERDNALLWQSRQRAFVQEHMARWVPAFSAAVIRSTQVDFYRALARLTQAFIEREASAANREVQAASSMV